MDSLETVSAAYEAFGRGDVPALLELLDDNVQWSAPMTLPHGGQFRGKADVGRFFQGIGEIWDPLTLELEGLAVTSEGDVIGLIKGTGTLRSGGPGGYAAAHRFAVRDGKITNFQEYVDLDKPLSG